MELFDHNTIPVIGELDPEQHHGGSDAHGIMVVDTWPRAVPVAAAEIEVTETYLAQLLDAIIPPPNAKASLP